MRKFFLLILAGGLSVTAGMDVGARTTDEAALDHLENAAAHFG